MHGLVPNILRCENTVEGKLMVQQVPRTYSSLHIHLLSNLLKLRLDIQCHCAKLDLSGDQVMHQPLLPSDKFNNARTQVFKVGVFGHTRRGEPKAASCGRCICCMVEFLRVRGTGALLCSFRGERGCGCGGKDPLWFGSWERGWRALAWCGCPCGRGCLDGIRRRR